MTNEQASSSVPLALSAGLLFSHLAHPHLHNLRFFRSHQHCTRSNTYISVYLYIFFVVCARAMDAASSLISLNFTNCQLCALVNIFTSFRLASNSWLTGPGFSVLGLVLDQTRRDPTRLISFFPEHCYMSMSVSVSDNFFSIVLAVVFIALNANLFHVAIVLHLWVKGTTIWPQSLPVSSGDERYGVRRS